MASSNLERVQKNVGTMIDKRAPESDIDAYLDSEGVTADQLRANKSMFGPTVKAIGKGLLAGAKDAVKYVGDTAANLVYPLSSTDLEKAYAESHPDAKVNPFGGLVSSARRAVNQADQQFESYIAPENAPLGYLQSGVRGLTSQGLLGGPNPANLASGTGGGLVGEAAANVFNGSPLARTAGQLIGSIGFGLPFATGTGTTASLNRALENVTPQQMAQADQLVKLSYAKGAPLTATEAIQQVTGVNPALGIAQRQVERSPATAGQMGPFMAQRPAQNQALMNDALTGMGPSAAEPGRLPQRLNTAAENAVETARKGVNAQTRPLYAQAESGVIKLKPGLVNQVIQSDPVLMQAYKAIRAEPAYQKELANPDPTNGIRILDLIYKHLHVMADAAAPAELAPNGKNFAVASRIGDVRSNLNAFIRQTWPSWGKAQDMQDNLRYTNVEPLQMGQIGDIGKVKPVGDKAFSQQMDKLLPENPQLVDVTDVKKTIANLRLKDPNLAQEAIKQWLGARWNAATQDLQTGANQFGGVKFRTQMAGNTQQYENLQAAVEASAGKQAWRGLDTAFKIFEAQGMRMPAGSDTNANALMSARTSDSALQTLTNPKGWLRGWSNLVQNKGNVKLADVLTSPDGVAKLRELAGMNPTSPKTRALVFSLFKIGSEVSSKQDGEANDNP